MERSKFEEALRLTQMINEINNTITKISNAGPNISYVVIKGDGNEEVLMLSELKYLLSDMLGGFSSRLQEIKTTLESDFNNL